ncbi:MAG: type II secretion system F family protein, partial [Hyphomicrobiaceae bacterium]
MADADPIQLLGLLLGAIAVGGLALALMWPWLSGEKTTEKRIANVTENRQKRTTRVIQQEQLSNRKQQVADTLKDLENKQNQKEKLSLRVRLQRAGLEITPKAFWIASGCSGVAFAVAIMVFVSNAPPIAAAAGGFVGAFGFPRWVLKFLTKRRQNKFVNNFANAIDIIVRGVKSGLPLNECLSIIARESPAPLNEEFREVVDQSRIGIPLNECLDRMMGRMPLPEVKFFAIVISIQQQAGGNLSEALGNLSGVLRDRKTLTGKVKALSAEAKASAMVLGALPFIVMSMVYMSAPKYIAVLFQTMIGNFMLACA